MVSTATATGVEGQQSEGIRFEFQCIVAIVEVVMTVRPRYLVLDEERVLQVYR